MINENKKIDLAKENYAEAFNYRDMSDLAYYNLVVIGNKFVVIF